MANSRQAWRKQHVTCYDEGHECNDETSPAFSNALPCQWLVYAYHCAGRKTGRLYTTPVYYHQEGKVVGFFSGKHLKWEKNLVGGAVVTLRLRDIDVQGIAALSTDDAASQQLLKTMYPRMSAEKAAEQLMIEVRL